MPGDKDDLKPGGFPTGLKWSGDDAIASLESLYTFANSECDQASKWYFVKKRSKRIYGQFFRVGAILTAAISGIIPIIGEIYENDGVPIISPAWATIALAVAALLVFLDRFGGFTSGWIRYIRTGMTLNRIQSLFRVEWEETKVTLHSGEVNAQAIREAIKQCKAFLDEVHQTVNAETDQWAQEFQKVLLELEKRTGRKDPNA